MQETTKYVVFFDEGDGRDKRLLGGKGAGLCEMTKLGLPVPPGFVITTEVCNKYYESGRQLPLGLSDQVRASMKRLEQITGKGFGDKNNPLLVSVRSGAPISMPGMMDTVLNLGLNEDTVQGLAKQSNNPRFAWDAYRRFVQMFGKIVLGVNDEAFSKLLEDTKKRKRVKFDSELDAETLKDLTKEFIHLCEKHTGKKFPYDPYEQLELAVDAVFRSWMGERAVEYRKYYKITPDIAHGTAVNVVTMVFGNMGNDSATGVVFTRDPETGEKKLYGEFLINAQGEDVVAGVRTPEPIDKLKIKMPKAYQQLLDTCNNLERHYKEPQDVEFTIEHNKLYMLQTRAGKMNATAMVKTSVDMVNEGIITKEESILRINPDELEQLLHKRVHPKNNAKPIASGIGASPGAAHGKVVFDVKKAEEMGKKGEKVILVREETKPDDVPAFFVSVGILTSRGGKTSHAAVVARGMGKPCVVGCSEISIDYRSNRFVANGQVVKANDTITLDGVTGNVYLGQIPTIDPEMTKEFEQLLRWAAQFKRLGIRANADTPETVALARKFGAQGIGLCRTERMFNAKDRMPLFVKMIMARTEKDRLKALNDLKPLQKTDFKAILKAMEGYPVTIRLLDPPLHEFLPRIEDLLRDIYESGRKSALRKKKEKIFERAKELAEINPMMGHRGVRIGITFPEIYGMQIGAICEATAELARKNVNVQPQIMIPQVGSAEELITIKRIYEKVKKEVEERYQTTLNIKFGTMIEVVRACLTADSVAEVAEFFSFGTNDLTQAVFSFSREDVEGKFLPFYIERGIMMDNPFQTLDVKGVGKAMKIAIELGKSVNRDLEIGICGEHGGDPRSIEFCDTANLDYVSASPHRIPIAIMAAAKSAVKRKSQVQ
ncbi:MAG: pyruvate, phosphate dikinase [Nitrososphaerales archaeon]